MSSRQAKAAWQSVDTLLDSSQLDAALRAAILAAYREGFANACAQSNTGSRRGCEQVLSSSLAQHRTTGDNLRSLLSRLRVRAAE